VLLFMISKDGVCQLFLCSKWCTTNFPAIALLSIHAETRTSDSTSKWERSRVWLVLLQSDHHQNRERRRRWQIYCDIQLLFQISFELIELCACVCILIHSIIFSKTSLIYLQFILRINPLSKRNSANNDINKVIHHSAKSLDFILRCQFGDMCL